MLGVVQVIWGREGEGGLGRAVSSTSSRVGSHREPGGGERTRLVGSSDHSELGRRERTGVDFIVPNFARGGGGRAWGSLSAGRGRGD
jgi:hypothetical protein